MEFHQYSDDEPETANQGDTSPPLLLSDKVKCDAKRTLSFNDPHNWYMLRLTPENDNYLLDDVKELCSNLTIEELWFIAEEKSRKNTKHFHCVFWSPNDPRQEIKDWLILKFPAVWKKADGNKRYNLQQVEDLTKCFTYSSKDGDFIYGSGINPGYVNFVNSQSFQKKDSRISRLLTARADYIKDKLTDEDLFNIVCDVCITTSATGSMNMTYVKSFMTGAKCQKDPQYQRKLFVGLGL